MESSQGSSQVVIPPGFWHCWSPSWPVALPVSQRAIEEDWAWKDLQGQWSFHGLAVSHSLVRLKAAVNVAIAHAEDNPAFVAETLLWLRDDVNEQGATPLAHALCKLEGA